MLKIEEIDQGALNEIKESAKSLRSLTKPSAGAFEFS